MPLRIAGAQLDLIVGDITGNESRIIEAMAWAVGEKADVLLLPEMAVNGYPPEDLVLRDDFVDAGVAALGRIAAHSGEMTTVVGFVDRSVAPEGPDDSVERDVANAAAVIRRGEIVGVYHKVLLPNYGVFDEDRYFSVGSSPQTAPSFTDHRNSKRICLSSTLLWPESRLRPVPSCHSSIRSRNYTRPWSWYSGTMSPRMDSGKS